MPVRKREFDVDLFRKRVRLFDSKSEGERDVAIRQALQQCTDCDPPLLFWEAVSAACGPMDSRFHAAFAELQERLEQRESEAAQLADKYMEAQNRIEQLTNEREGREQNHNFHDLVLHTWSFPQSRFLLLAIVILARLIFYGYWRDSESITMFWLTNVTAASAGLLLFCKWTSLQFGEAGLLQLLLKWFLFGGGSLLSLNLFLGRYVWDAGFDLSFWAGRSLPSPGPGVTLFVFVAVLTVSRFSNWLTENLGMRLWESAPVQVLRGCF